MRPSSTLPTQWSTAWKRRSCFGPDLLDPAGQVDARCSATGRRGCAGSGRRSAIAARTDRAVLVRHVVRLLEHGRALRARVGDALVDVGHLEGQVDHAVAVRAVVVGEGEDGSTAPRMTKRAEPDLQDEALVVAVAGLGAGVADQRHAERRLVEVRALRRVAGHEHDRVHRGDGEGVGRLVVVDQSDQLLEPVDRQGGFALVGGEVDARHHLSLQAGGRCATQPFAPAGLRRLRS